MTTSRASDEDRAELLQYMRPEEDLREHRRFQPWGGEFRLFRSVNVVKLEDYRLSGEASVICARIQQRRAASRG
jgi:hypothetical protein